MPYRIDDDFSLRTTLSTLHIMYIEDDEKIQASITKVLHYFSSHIKAITSAEEALICYEDFKPDIIICDINLPGMNGIEFIKKLRSFDTHTQIFILSAYTDKTYLMDAIKLSLVDYLTKPIDFYILEKTLKEAAKRVLQQKTLYVNFITGATYYYQDRRINYQEDIYTLTTKEVKLLDYLIANKMRMTSKEELKSMLWDEDMASESAFKSLINKLRLKIGKEAIENISGIGYRIVFAVT